MNTSPDVILDKYSILKKSFRNNKTLPLEYRLEQLRNLFYGVKEYQETLKQALNKDLHRSPHETQNLELNQVLEEIDKCINNLHKWAKEESTGWTGLTFATAETKIASSPLGVVLMISPWNYPFSLSLIATASAIAAGNCVLLKPTEVIENSSQATTHMIEKWLDPEIIQVVNGGIPETTLLLEQKWDKIMVTGSGKVGQIVAEAAAKHMTPVILELGGKSPVFISKTADLPVTAKRVMWGKLSNAGQTCVAPDYILIEKGIEQEFIQECKKAVEEFYPNINKDTKDYAHCPNKRQFDRLVDVLSKTKGNVVLGGGSDSESLFIEPTIVSNVGPSDSLMEDELFGPLLPIITVDNLEQEGVDFVVDNHDTPLALYVFTNDRKQADLIFNKTRSGGASMNDVVLHVGCSSLPFGGVGTSGHGAYHGKYGFDAFSHKRAILRQPFWVEFLMKVRYAPYSDKKTKQMGAMGVPSPWYPRTGPVKRSFLARVFGSKHIVWVIGVLAAVTYRMKNKSNL